MNDVREQMIAALPRMRRFAYCLTGAFDEADDLVHDAIERVIHHTELRPAEKRFDIWMFGVIRRAWLGRAVPAGHRQPETLAQPVPKDGGQEAAREPVDAKLPPDQVREALARLPEQSRIVLLLICVEKFDYHDVADLLEIPVNDVTSRLALARLLLAREFQARGAVGEPA